MFLRLQVLQAEHRSWILIDLEQLVTDRYRPPHAEQRRDNVQIDLQLLADVCTLVQETLYRAPTS